ncbi:hypothetical protein [Pararhodobacter sp.]|uniref:hypothetical protein n=1 Tax=Pararhodobacter sp. TaxID=2127056 RepID=UPI002AFE2872|nr:hypothetical protein [Pararhodobacter sp.]
MALSLTSAASAQDRAPLSAIDWLRTDDTVPTPGAYPLTPPQPTAADSGISVRALDALRPEAAGLFPASRVGLPATLWGTSSANQLADLISTLPTDMVPALRDLSLRLLLAEFTAPLPEPGVTQDRTPRFLLARIDKLIEFGALDQAAAVLDTLDPVDPVLRLRRFDIGLLLGDEHQACIGVLAQTPPIDNVPALVFCQARDGNWDAAAEILNDATEAQAISDYDAELLLHFIEGHEGLPGASTLLPPPTGTPSPLVWRLLEASGDPVSTLGLPVAYAHADLRGTIGWRAQLEAAERLVRMGALSPNRLLGLYTERRAAASGGIWERVRLVQQLDESLRTDDPAVIGPALLQAWPQVQAGELEVAMSELYSQALGQVQLTGRAADLAFRIRLLSDSYETVALGLDATRASPEQRFLAAIARGFDPAAAGAMPGEVAQAVALAFGPDAFVPQPSLDALAEGRLGEEMLRILNRMGGPGDPRALSEGLATLRHMGLEDIARRTALESLMLERRG